MKICVIIDAWEPIWGGGQTHVWEISKCLVLHFGYEIDIYTRQITDGSDKKYTAIESHFDSKLRIIRIGPSQSVFSLLGRMIWVLTVSYQIVKLHRRSAYSLLHAHAYISAIPGRIVQMLTRIPLVYTVHGSHLMDHGKRSINYYIEKFLLTQIKYDAEISVSKSFTKYANVNKNILCISNGVNIDRFDSYKAKKRKNNSFVFLWVGRFDWTKGIDILFGAFAKLAKNNRNKIMLRLVGYGYKMREYQNLAKTLGIQQKVVFAGKKSGKDLIREYKSADVFVLPSLVEGQAVTLFEAWAAKLPVIASDAGDHASIVKPGKNGYLVPAGENSALFESMFAALKNKKLEKLGRSGYLTTKKLFSWEKSAATQHRIYKQLGHYEKNE